MENTDLPIDNILELVHERMLESLSSIEKILEFVADKEEE